MCITLFFSLSVMLEELILTTNVRKMAKNERNLNSFTCNNSICSLYLFLDMYNSGFILLEENKLSYTGVAWRVRLHN